MRFELTAERAREVLSYDPETGEFTWLARSGADPVTKGWNTRYAGSKAGATDSAGCRQIAIDGKAHLAHRLAWLMVHGRWPREQIDHINGRRNDNRLINLREASRAENAQNIGPNRRNKVGFLGVSRNEKLGKWVAFIGLNKKNRYLGSFETAEGARDAYLAAKRELHVFQTEPRGRAS